MKKKNKQLFTPLGEDIYEKQRMINLKLLFGPFSFPDPLSNVYKP
jgi:hypothetical protein